MTDEYGPRSSSTEYFDACKRYLEKTVCDPVNRGVVIPLITQHRREKGSAWNAAAEMFYNEGLTPRIYVLYEKEPSVSELISKLRATSPHPNETFSVSSVKPGRILMSLSLSNETIRPQRNGPSRSG